MVLGPIILSVTLFHDGDGSEPAQPSPGSVVIALMSTPPPVPGGRSVRGLHSADWHYYSTYRASLYWYLLNHFLPIYLLLRFMSTCNFICSSKYEVQIQISAVLWGLTFGRVATINKLQAVIKVVHSAEQTVENIWMEHIAYKTQLTIDSAVSTESTVEACLDNLMGYTGR